MYFFEQVDMDRRRNVLCVWGEGEQFEIEK